MDVPAKLIEKPLVYRKCGEILRVLFPIAEYLSTRGCTPRKFDSRGRRPRIAAPQFILTLKA
jgi:hypothetical protein